MPALLANAAAAAGAVAPLLQRTPDSQTGYVWLFVLLAATPYVLLVVIGGGIFRARRKQREQEVERALQEQQVWESVQHHEDSSRPA